MPTPCSCPAPPRLTCVLSQNETNAIQAALQVVDALGDMVEHRACTASCDNKLKHLSVCPSQDMEVRCGIATGIVFCGSVGSETRQELAVVGPAMVLAARLMYSKRPSAVCLLPWPPLTQLLLLCRIQGEQSQYQCAGRSGHV